MIFETLISVNFKIASAYCLEKRILSIFGYFYIHFGGGGFPVRELYYKRNCIMRSVNSSPKGFNIE
jgi:hypothetical protein